MSNELKKIVKAIQFKTDKTIAEIAKEIGYARAYFTNQVNIGTNKKLKELLLEKFPLDTEQKVITESNTDHGKHKNDIIYFIELKTASGKIINVVPEGESEITLLNAFLEERDRVINTKQERIDELSKDKEELYKLLSSSLGDISTVQKAIFAMVRTLQQHEAVITSQGNKKREAEMLDTLSKLNGDNLKVDAKQDSAVVLHKSGK